MKKVLSILMCAMLVLSLAACGSGSGPIKAKDGYAEGAMGDTMATYFFNYTVNSAYTCKEYSGYRAAEGNELLVVNVTVKNTTRNTVEMFDTDFQAQWFSDKEEDFRVPITTDPETFDELDTVSEAQLPGTYSLKAKEERTGDLVFEVPTGFKEFSVSYLEVFDDDTEGDVFFVDFTPEVK